MTDDEARQLDLTVAEKVMGWKRAGDNDLVSPGHGRDGNGVNWQRKGPHPRLESPDGDGVHYLCPCSSGRLRSGHIDLPPYSTDIAEAWKVVEHFRDLWTAATQALGDADVRDRELIARLEDDLYDHPPFNHQLFFERLHRHADRRWPWALLYITPEAICRAALEAVNA